MDANLVIEDNKATIRLAGRFDFHAHRQFRDAADGALGNSGVKQVQIDLARVVYLDSSALGMLLMLRDKAKHANKQVALANCSGSVKQVLDVANFTKLFTIV